MNEKLEFQKLNINSILLLILLIFPTSIHSQYKPEVLTIDTLENNLDALYHRSTKGLLTDLKRVSNKYLRSPIPEHEYDNALKRITTLYIRFAELLTDDGLDLKFNYSSLTCVRWSVMYMADSTTEDGKREIETREAARQANAQACQKLNVYRTYLEFNEDFLWYYENYFNQDRKEFEAILNDYYANNEDASRDQVTRLLMKPRRAPSLSEFDKHIYNKGSQKYLNEVLLEVGGYGLYSINYCRRIMTGTRFGINAGVGVSPSTFFAETSKLRIPFRLQVDYYFKRNQFITGFGVTPYLADGVKGLGGWEGGDIAIFLEIGYLLNRGKNQFGISFTPLVYDNRVGYFSPWGALKYARRF